MFITVTAATTPEQFAAWGWRLPFLLSAPIFAISFYVRMKVEESPLFKRAVQRAAPERVPLLAVLERCKVATLQVLLCAMAESSTFYFTSVFGLSYGIQTLKLSNSLLLSGVAIGNAIGIITNPVFGALSDRIGRRPLLGASYFLAALYVLFLFFPHVPHGRSGHRDSAMAIPGAILQPLSLAVSGSFYPERFADAKLRLSGGFAGTSARNHPRRRTHADDRRIDTGVVRRIADMGARLLRADLRPGSQRGRLRERDCEDESGNRVMKTVAMLVAVLAFARIAAAQNADDYRGGWRTDSGEAHTYEFSIRGKTVRGIYCTYCADATTLAFVDGTFGPTASRSRSRT